MCLRSILIPHRRAAAHGVCFHFIIHRRGGFVQYEYGGRFEHGPGDGSALSLSARKFLSPLSREGVSWPAGSRMMISIAPMQIAAARVSQIMAIQQDAALLFTVKAQQQCDDGAAKKRLKLMPIARPLASRGARQIGSNWEVFLNPARVHAMMLVPSPPDTRTRNLLP